MYTGVPSGVVLSYTSSNIWSYVPPASLSLIGTVIVGSPGALSATCACAGAATADKPIVVAAAMTAPSTRRVRRSKICIDVSSQDLGAARVAAGLSVPVRDVRNSRLERQGAKIAHPGE